MARRAAARTLLLGMGNPLLRDDAVGVRLASSLSLRLGPVRDMDVVADTSAGGLELLPIVQGYERLIVCDAIRGGAVPGRWCHFTGADLRSTLHLTNVHDTNFATALELGRRVGLAVPAATDTHVFAVEVEDAMTFDERMTPALERAFPSCVEEILPEVIRLIRLPPGPARTGRRSTPAGPPAPRR